MGEKITETVAAKILNISPATLLRIRKEGKTGPPWYDYKKGKGGKALVKYDLEELITWIETTKQTPGA